MSRQSLTALTIVAAVLVVVSIILMATVMAGAFGAFGHGPYMDSPFSSSPRAWTLMIVAMVLGGLGIVAFALVLVRATGLAPNTSLRHSAPSGPAGIAATLVRLRPRMGPEPD